MAATVNTGLLAPGAMAVPVAAPVGVGTAVSGFEILDRLPGVFVREDVNLMQMITGFEMENNFEIFALEPVERRPVGEPIFHAHESSSCFQRQCCGPMREFEMDISTHGLNRQVFSKLYRPFKCTIACFNRSVIYCQSAIGEDLGEIYHPWACCDRVLEVRAPTPREGGINPLPLISRDGNNGVWYQIRADCCQPGNFCSCPCGACKNVVFNIYGPDGSGKPIGELCKTFSGCLKQAYTQADNFTLIFPEGATAYQKATLLSAVMLVDFLYFEKRKQNNNNNM